MVVSVNTIEAVAGSKEHQLAIVTQDAVDVPLLQELFAKAPAGVRANLHVERKGDYSSGTLYWNWPHEA